MAEITLIELCRQSVGKNYICHLLAPSQTISLDVCEEMRSYVVVTDHDTRYCLTGNPEVFDPDSQYVLLTNKTPTKYKLQNGEIKQKRWLKHPQMIDVTPEEVRATWTNQFFYKEEEDNHPGLRKPQLGALYAVLSHFLAPNDVATVVLPTGTGKTETMLSALIAGKCERLLVLVPSNALRTQLFGKFKTLGVLKNKQFGIVGDDALYPIVGIINTAFVSAVDLKAFVSRCNVVVTTMQIIDSASREQQDIYVSTFSNVYVDEAHHIVATSWKKFADRFPKNRLIQFTATPFRNDGKRLDGKIIFNYPLKQAQVDGYYRTINFLPIREYDDSLADRAIATRAIAQLNSDLAVPYRHILMARCESKARAEEVYKIYQELCPELNPVILYSGHSHYRENYEKILHRQTHVVVCVNMLGEGFDLPELKIAAFHDIRKSLPVTLQFAGRFTRTSRDEQLGNASFVANLADVTVQQELDNLYEEDADWNILLANANDGRISNQEEYRDLLEGFRNDENAIIPVSSIYPKLSAVVYKSYIHNWNPEEFYKGIRGYESLDFKSFDINDKERIVVAVLAKDQNVEGIRVKEVHTLAWNYIILFWDSRKNLLFINSSDNGSIYRDVAKHVIGEQGREPDIINGTDVFRIFYNLKRTKLRNVGLKVYLGKDIRFRMHAGRDVERVLTSAELRNSEKAFVVGDGFEGGEKVSIGASFKGRIWSLSGSGDILAFKRWCLEQGEKLTDGSINGNQILTETLIPKTISELPSGKVPFGIDWDAVMWTETETHFSFNMLGSESYLYNTDIKLRENCSAQGNSIFFVVTNGQKSVEFKLELFKNNQNPDNVYADYRIVQISTGEAFVKYGKKQIDMASFLYENVPTIFFTDGSSLCGTEYIELKDLPALFDKNRLKDWNWDGVDISVESQGIKPNLKTNSIQYKVIQELSKDDYDIIYDDDNAGEIADVVTLKQANDTIHIGLFHLKYAHGGVVSDRIVNFYEVCGQAQKSSNWKYKEPEEMVSHLLRRETKRGTTGECSRIQKGNHDTLVRLLQLARKKIPVKYSIYIVQPGVSKKKVSNEILTLLGVTDSFLKERTGIDLNVITNE